METKKQIKVKKRDNGPRFVADSESLARVLTSGGRSQRVVLGGPLVLGAIGPLPVPDGYTGQEPRPAARSWPWSRPPSAEARVSVALEREAVDLLMRGRAKASLVVDVLLKVGQRIRAENSFVVAAVEGSMQSAVTVMRFRKAVAVEIKDYLLPHPSTAAYEADQHMLLEKLRLQIPGAPIHWCGPLAAPRSQKVETHPASVWNTAPVLVLTRSGRPGLFRRHGIAMAIVALSVAGAGATLWEPYQQYQQAAQQLARENAQLKGEYRFASERLQLLRARESFYGTFEGNAAVVRSFESVLNTFAAHPDVRIVEASVLWPRGKTLRASRFPHDFEIVIEVARNPESTALAQSVPLMHALSAQLGTGLRLSANDGMRDEPGAASSDSPGYRYYRIQGDLPDAS